MSRNTGSVLCLASPPSKNKDHYLLYGNSGDSKNFTSCPALLACMFVCFGGSVLNAYSVAICIHEVIIKCPHSKLEFTTLFVKMHLTNLSFFQNFLWRGRNCLLIFKVSTRKRGIKGWLKANNRIFHMLTFSDKPQA